MVHMIKYWSFDLFKLVLLYAIIGETNCSKSSILQALIEDCYIIATSGGLEAGTTTSNTYYMGRKDGGAEGYVALIDTAGFTDMEAAAQEAQEQQQEQRSAAGEHDEGSDNEVEVMEELKALRLAKAMSVAELLHNGDKKMIFNRVKVRVDAWMRGCVDAWLRGCVVAVGDAEDAWHGVPCSAWSRRWRWAGSSRMCPWAT
jgi:hypothetical protein